jgi:hypothetical protein
MTEDACPTKRVPVADRQPHIEPGVDRGPRSRMRLSWCAGLVLAFVAAIATTVHADDDIQLWITANTAGAVAGPYLVAAELHGRWTDDARNYQRTVIRLQAGRALTKGRTAWFGFEQNWPVAGRTAREPRLWQQLTFVQAAGAWALFHRARMEERFPDDADRMIPRFRYSLRATRPLHAESPWRALLGAELFFQLRDARRSPFLHPAGFDRDRLQAGISRRLTHAITLEPSYLLQFINYPAPALNRWEHLLQLQVAHRF